MNPEGVPLPDWALWLVAAAAVVTALGVLYRKVVKPLVRAASRVHEIYDNTAQLTRNSGTHLADAVYRIEAEQQNQRIEAEEDRKALAVHVQQAQDELVKVWQHIAARDVVKSAAKTAESIDHAERERGD